MARQIVLFIILPVLMSISPSTFPSPSSSPDWSGKFEKEFGEIEKLKKEGKNRSAFDKAAELTDRAIDSLNIPGLVLGMKSLIENAYAIEEEAFTDRIQILIGKSIKEPVTRAFFDSYLAELLTTHYERIRSRIPEGHPQESAPDPQNIDRWSGLQYETLIDSLYSASVKPAELSEIPAEKAILIFNNEKEDFIVALRPRVFDLLQERYLHFLQNPRLHRDPVEYVAGKEEAAQLAAKDLSRFLEEKETEAGIFFRIILARHVLEESLFKSGYEEAWLDAVLQRLDYVKTVVPEAEREKITHTLQVLEKEYGDLKNGAAPSVALAETEMGKQQYRHALEILESVRQRQRPGDYSYYIKRAEALIRQIKTTSVRTEAEETYPQGRSPLVSFIYRNTDQIDLELFEVTGEEFVRWQFSNQTDEEKLKAVPFKVPLWKQSLKLPTTEDYREHRTEAMIRQDLPFGAYALKYYAEGDSTEISGYVFFQVTHLGMILTERDSSELFVLDRRTGERRGNARVSMTEIETYPDFKIKKVRPLHNQDGRFLLRPERRANFFYTITLGEDRYISSAAYLYPRYPSVADPVEKTVIFTDRSIYKPGDIVRFKAMTLFSKRLTTELLQNREITITLRDANGKEVRTENFRTDEWGTVAGSVTLPASGLKGSWSLQASPSGNRMIRVEEYVRPNFELEISDISHDDDRIGVRGEASTYSGFPVGEATGRTEVRLLKRQWFLPGRDEEKLPFYEEQISTDPDGNFEFYFPKEQVRAQSGWNRWIYYYEIQISLQAPSGELRTLTKQIPLQTDQVMIVPEYKRFYQLADLSSVGFSVKNAMNEPAEKEVSWALYQLETPNRYKTDRYWQIPDDPMIPREEFEKEQPEFFYDHLSDPEEWPTGKRISAGETMLKDQDSLALRSRIAEEGYYRLVLQSKEGDTLTSATFGVASPSHPDIVHTPWEWMPDRKNAQPGDTVRVSIYAAKGLKNALVYLERPTGKVEQIPYPGSGMIPVSVSEKDLGGIQLRVFGYLNNRFFEKSLRIEVPWTEKHLEVEPEVFSNSLEMNKDTVLTVNISDSHGNGVKSEIAAVIYDASLDAYLPHSWNPGETFFRTFYPGLSVRNLTGHLAFSRNVIRDDRRAEIIVPPLITPELLYFTPVYYWNFGGITRTMRENNIMYMAAPAKAAAEEASPEAQAGNADSLQGMNRDSDENSAPVPDLRKNFEETMLFRGKLQTDDNGRVEIPFTTNDKAGRWKVLIFAHTRDMKHGDAELTFETTRDLYLEGFIPELVRQGDSLELRFTVYNNTSEAQSGVLEWEIRSPGTEETLPGKKYQNFEIGGNRSTVYTLPVSIPENQETPLVIQSVLKDVSGNIRDKVQNILPVLPSAQRIVEGEVFVLQEGEELTEKNWGKWKLKAGDEVRIRVVQNMYSELLKSIPYLHNDRPTTTDQYFRNAAYAMMGKYITGKTTDFEEIYNEWKRKGELISRLAQNEEDKYAELTRTPWWRQSESGTVQMAKLAFYFDENHMADIISKNESKWIKGQNPDGGFPWIDEGPSSFYITGSFLRSLAKMKWAGIPESEDYQAVIRDALKYMDGEFLRTYEKEQQKDSTFRYRQFEDYFMTRAYYPTEGTSEAWQKAWTNLQDSVRAHWAESGLAGRVNAGIAAYYLDDESWSRKVVESLADNAIRDKELGVYWRTDSHRNYENSTDYPGILSSISELLILHDEKQWYEGIKQWVLVNKMTNDWHNNPNVFPLMLGLLKMETGFTSSSVIRITQAGQVRTITGFGDSETIIWKMGEGDFKIENLGKTTVWAGALTSRKAEPGDLEAASDGILTVRKNISPLTEGGWKMGEKIKVRLEIESDREMDYVYLKDPLSPGADPGINLSGHRWARGLSYYQSFSHEAAEFFIAHLPRGRYVIEYELGVIRAGVFVQPASVIQSYFVPEITGYDPGIPIFRFLAK